MVGTIDISICMSLSPSFLQDERLYATLNQEERHTEVSLTFDPRFVEQVLSQNLVSLCANFSIFYCMKTIRVSLLREDEKRS